MARFGNKGKKKTPAISTSSLPDIIYMLLFFFMVTTVMREVTLMVEIDLPEAREISKLENKSAIGYIYIGSPMSDDMKEKLGPEARIQLNNQFAEINEIKTFVLQKQNSLKAEDQAFYTTMFKADNGTEMGLVTDVKQELRQIGAFKISYSSRKKID